MFCTRCGSSMVNYDTTPDRWVDYYECGNTDCKERMRYERADRMGGGFDSATFMGPKPPPSPPPTFEGKPIYENLSDYEQKVSSIRRVDDNISH